MTKEELVQVMDRSERALAQKVIQDSLRVTGSDIVVINTWDWTSSLASALALECFRAGADTLMTLYTDDFYFEHMRILSEDDLRQTSRHCLELADYASVEIFLGGPQNHSRFKDVPASKMAATAQGEKAHMEKNRQRRIRTAILEFSVVHPQVAKTYRFDYAKWKRTVRSAVMIDYGKVSKFGARLASTLEQGHTIHITQGRDTDLSLEIAGRVPYVFDGVIDEKDLEQGQVVMSLPSGTVEMAPIETSADGRVRFDVSLPRSGRLVQGMSWRFEDGILTQFSADRNVGAIRNRWQMATGDKGRIGSLILGINPQAKLGFNIDTLAQAAVSIGIGRNRHLGGLNDTDFAVAGTLSRANVELDETPIIRNGRYVT